MMINLKKMMIHHYIYDEVRKDYDDNRDIMKIYQYTYSDIPAHV